MNNIPRSLLFLLFAPLATAGGWEWKRCGAVLAADGHTVHRATLIEESVNDKNQAVVAN